jgi:hypothetical protein
MNEKFILGVIDGYFSSITYREVSSLYFMVSLTYTSVPFIRGRTILCQSMSICVVSPMRFGRVVCWHIAAKLLDRFQPA